MEQDKYAKLLLEQFDKADESTKENIIAYVSGVIAAITKIEQNKKKN